MSPAPKPSKNKDTTGFKLVKQLVPFTLNVSHYMTDLVYTLYYLRMSNEGQTTKKDIEALDRLSVLQDELCKETLQLRGNFKSLLERISFDPVTGEEARIAGDTASTTSKESEVQSLEETVAYFKRLVNDKVINLIYRVNQSILNVLDDKNSNVNDSETTDKRNLKYLITQLDNCLLGFTNLCNFLNQIPIRDANKANGNHMQAILDVFQNELLSTWKVQLDLLNCKVFDLISGEPRIIKLFRESTGLKEDDYSTVAETSSTNTTSTSSPAMRPVEGEAFIKLVNWLKDDQVFSKFSVE